MKLWNHGNSVDENKAHAWLMRVTHNQCIDCYRRRIRIRYSGDAAVDGFHETSAARLDTSADPESEIELSETQQALLEAMERLPTTTRSLLLMHYFEDLPLERIGEIMGMSTNAVKVAIHRGRKSLKGMLEKQHSDLIGERIS